MLHVQSYVNAKIQIISENSKQAVDKLTPTITANTPRELLSHYRKGYDRTTNENKKVSAVIFPSCPCPSCNSK